MALDDSGYDRDDAFPELRFMPDKDAKRKRIVRQGYAVLAAAAVISVALGAAVLSLSKRD
jgi:hypothetical protein